LSSSSGSSINGKPVRRIGWGGNVEVVSGETVSNLVCMIRGAQKLAGRGIIPAGVSGARARATEQMQLAREIGQALERNDIGMAQALIRDAAALYWHRAMSAAVEAAARQAHEVGVIEHYTARSQAARDDEEPYPDDTWEDRYA
jgi:hypothetical protein